MDTPKYRFDEGKGTKGGQSHTPAPGARDPNDEKMMADSPDNSVGREVEASNTTLNEYKNSPIASYYEFPSSNNVAVETYSKRADKIMAALGNKDEVKS